MTREVDRCTVNGRANACRDDKIKPVVNTYLSRITDCGGNTVDRSVFFVRIRHGLHITCRVFVAGDTNQVWASGLLTELAALLSSDFTVTEYSATGGIVHGLDVVASPPN